MKAEANNFHTVKEINSMIEQKLGKMIFPLLGLDSDGRVYTTFIPISGFEEIPLERIEKKD